MLCGGYFLTTISMALIKWKPLGDLDWFFDESFPAPASSSFGWDLAVDLYEKGGDIIAEMNLPGIDPEKLDVSVEGDLLYISGSREESQEKKERRYHSKEIRRGSFERTVRLPALVQKDKVTAEYKNGMLRVTLPKTEV